MWNPFKKKEKSINDLSPDDTAKLEAENAKVLNSMTILAQRVQATGQPDLSETLSQQDYLDRLRREGSGL